MSAVKELIRTETDGSVSFGDYTLDKKSKLSDFEHNGDLYKVKTYNEITKLERNGMFVYESVPGTAVEHFTVNERYVSFIAEGNEDAQITVGLAEDTEYDILVDDVNVGRMKTNLGGKLSLSVELEGGRPVKVDIVRA